MNTGELLHRASLTTNPGITSGTHESDGINSRRPNKVIYYLSLFLAHTHTHTHTRARARASKQASKQAYARANIHTPKPVHEALSDAYPTWYLDGRGFDPPVRKHSFVEICHETISVARIQRSSVTQWLAGWSSVWRTEGGWRCGGGWGGAAICHFQICLTLRFPHQPLFFTLSHRIQFRSDFKEMQRYFSKVSTLKCRW